MIMEKSLKHGKFYPELLPKPLTKENLKKTIAASKKEVSKLKLYQKDNFNKLLVGALMNKVRLQVNGSDIKNLISKEQI